MKIAVFRTKDISDNSFVFKGGKLKVVFIFVDGLGLGDNNPEYNPIKAADTKIFDQLLSNGYCKPTDATLGVNGLPQSATGQTTILTGVNASLTIGRHLSGFPSRTLCNLLEQGNLLKSLVSKGLRVTNANMFTKVYLEKILSSDSRATISATTVATIAAGLDFKTEKDMLEGRAVYQDLTNEILLNRGLHVPLRQPQEAGKILAGLLNDYDFVFFEYFQTDLAGHSRKKEACIKVIKDIDEMLYSLLSSINLNDNLFVLTSDHGNIEDLRTATHTYNPVPTVAVGYRSRQFLDKISSIKDITPQLGLFW